MLELADIEPYLRDRGLISARAVVDGGLRVTDVSRSSRVFLVTVAGERSLVVKVARTASDQSVAREAAVLESLWNAGGYGGLNRFLPRLIAHDIAAGVLILEATSGTRNLSHHHARGRFSRALAGQAGRALALLHDLEPAKVECSFPQVDPGWSLHLHRPDFESLRNMSSAAIELTRLIQRSAELCRGLDEALGSSIPQSMIHGDIRWDNCLVVRSEGSHRWAHLQLIDWEFAGAGDPARDLGAFFAEYLRVWVQSIPIADIHEPERLLSNASMPLGRMRPALSAFWDAYALRRRCRTSELSRTLRNATRFAGAAVLIAASEEAQMLAELPASALLLLAVSQNVFERPDEETARLVGLPDLTTAA